MNCLKITYPEIKRIIVLFPVEIAIAIFLDKPNTRPVGIPPFKPWKPSGSKRSWLQNPQRLVW